MQRVSSMPEVYDRELEVIIEIAKRVGAFLKNQQEKKIQSANGRDIKLFLDKIADEMIKEQLKKQFDYPILSEESGFEGDFEKEDLYWIIDPIDGTMNYSRGTGLSCVSIALYKNETPILGVIYDFNSDELFCGVVSQGAWLNEKRLEKKCVAKAKEEAILATGFPVYMELNEKSLTEFILQVQSYKKIRMIGSAALSLAYVAVGRFDAYMEKNIKLWDVAAGVAILRALDVDVSLEKRNDYLLDVWAGLF